MAQTLVQPGFAIDTPEFATGTMAINSTTTGSHAFSMNGPYITVKLTLD